MKKNVNYSLDKELEKDIIIIRNIILSKLEDAKIYLFGSIAKGRYSKESDIDLLVLVDSYKSTKELRILRHEIEDNIELLKLKRNPDIKIYNKDRYMELSKSPCFEKAILEDLVDIGEWKNG